jgi:hypothetical protein
MPHIVSWYMPFLVTWVYAIRPRVYLCLCDIVCHCQCLSCSSLSRSLLEEIPTNHTHTTHTLPAELKRLRLEDRHSSKSSEPMSYSQTVMNEKQSKLHNSSHSAGDGEAGHSSAPHEREREKPHNNHNKYVTRTMNTV